MRLNHECVRDIFLALENNLIFGESVDSFENFKELDSLDKYSDDELQYTLSKIEETNYLNMTTRYIDGSLYSISIGSITWEGHSFLDNIRDPKVWAKTKKIMSEFSSVSIGMISTTGSSIVK